MRLSFSISILADFGGGDNFCRARGVIRFNLFNLFERLWLTHNYKEEELVVVVTVDIELPNQQERSILVVP